ncbi:MAG: hypothetical protein ACRD0K_23395 [Egibacteraceae bacterium]
MFTHLSGSPLRRANFRRNHWIPAVKAAGLDGLRFHDLPHTFVALTVAAGADPKQVWSARRPFVGRIHASTATATCTRQVRTPSPHGSTRCWRRRLAKAW